MLPWSRVPSRCLAPASALLALLAACGGGGGGGGDGGGGSGGGDPVLPPPPPGSVVPAAPVVSSPPRKSSDNTPRLAGTAGPGVLLRLYAGATLLGGALADADGAWDVHPSVALADGTRVLHATAANTAGESGPSAGVAIEIDTVPPAAPAGLRAVAYSGVVDLTWDANAEPDLLGYNVYRKAPGATEFDRVPLNPRVVVGASYRDQGLVDLKRYAYRVTAVDDAVDDRRREHP